MLAFWPKRMGACLRKRETLEPRGNDHKRFSAVLGKHAGGGPGARRANGAANGHPADSAEDDEESRILKRWEEEAPSGA